MKKLFDKKIPCVLLAAVLLLSTFSIVAFADDGEDVEPYEWEMSTDQAMLWNDDREYYLYEVPFGCNVEFLRTYYFENGVYSNGSDFEISSYARDGEIVIAESIDYLDASVLCYATENGRKSIEDLAGGDYSGVQLYEYGNTAELKESTLSGLDFLNTGVEVDVTVLADVEHYDIRTHDSTGSVYHVYGALYKHEGGLWYLNYDRLSNDHFDAVGNFSYRRGKVTIYEVSDEALVGDILETAESLTYNGGVDYEDGGGVLDGLESFDGVVAAKIGFWAMLALIGLALPVWTLIIGIKNSHSGRHGNGRHWLIMSLASAVWIAIAVSVALIIIFG